MTDQKSLFQIIKGVLSTRTPQPVRNGRPSYRHAGVLIPLLEENGDHKVLFTKRTDRVGHHKGEISFPGGSVDYEDASIEETVLREVYEEVGLPGEEIEILGRTDDILTLVSNFVVHPFVGIIPSPYNFIVNAAEVERLIKVPLRVFYPGRSESKNLSLEFEGISYKSKAYEYKGDLIWGATARIMDNFVHIISHKLPLLDGH